MKQSLRWWARRKQLGMFWRFLVAMFLASFIGLEIFVILGSAYDEHKLIRKLDAPEFEAALNAELAKGAAIAHQTAGRDPSCALVLQTLVFNSNALKVLDNLGANSRERMAPAGRISLAYLQDGQTLCRYAPNAARRDAALDGASVSTYRYQVANPAQPGEQLQLHVDVLRTPTLQWVATKDMPWNALVLFVAVLNLCCAITLAPILVRRIKRAEKVARGWTEGDMHARIDDSRNDEFGSLVRSFNTLADSFVDVIKVKQELAAVEERNRLARDLHDTAKQRAFALNLQLTALRTLADSDPAEASRLTRSASSLVHHLQNDLSNVIRRLSASTVAELGMREVLRQEVASLFEGSAIDWQIHISDDIDDLLREAPHLAQQILLIAIEASANVLRHAQASRIVIAFQESEDRYTLCIEDDGRGFDDQNSDAMGMGLSNMRLRARSLPHGELSVTGGSAGGAAVWVRFRL
nr:histidine kinase [Herbaspirillum sp. LeCh32-8]